MSVHRNHRLAGVVPALALALGLALSTPFGPAAGAAAATARATVEDTAHGRVLFYTAAAGQTNRLTLTETHDEWYLRYVIDDSVPISTGSACTHPVSTDLTKVSCLVEKMDLPDPYATLEMRLGDRNDRVRADNASDQTYFSNLIDLGTGNDTSVSTGIIDGSRTYGRAGADVITVGRRGFADGGRGNDVIRGGAGPQYLTGGDGNDTISGGGSADRLYGGGGRDRLYGGSGNDSVYGNSGDDRLYGGRGDDQLYGGPGYDRIHGGPGHDTVHYG